jgi:concanavalin A-like lectin/glucanase superfamily protein
MKVTLVCCCTLLTLAAASAAALPASASRAVTAAKAQPASGSGRGQNLSAKVSSSWQTAGTVWALAPVKGKVYVGGNFTTVRPPGDPSGTGNVTRTYLAEFSASTGALVKSFDPTLDGQVTALAVARNGTLYVGGSFTHVNGHFRNHLAAFSTSTGALTSWAPNAGSSVLAIAPSPSGAVIYIGGNFGKLDGKDRTRAGAVNKSGSLLAWAPDLNGSVASIAVAPDDSRVLVGGFFSTFNGAAQQAVVSVDPTSGGSNNLTSIEPNTTSCMSTVKHIVIGSVTAKNPAGIAYIASEGTGGGCFDGDWAANVRTGALVWQNDCLGATQSLVIINNWLYKGSHAHDCDYAPGGFPQTKGLERHLLNQSLTDGSLGHWTPNTNNGNSSSGVVGGGLGPRVMATDGTQLFLGGDFTTVNNKRQQGFARFRPGPDTTPARPGRPTVISSSRGVDSVTFTGVSDPDDGTLTYSIFRIGVKRRVGTVTATSWPWALPVVHFRDAGLKPGSVHTYKVTASDGTSTSARSPASAPVRVARKNPSRTYQKEVLASKPSFFWRLDQRKGRTASDSSPHHFNGIYEPGTTKGAAGPIVGEKATATKFNGHTGLVTSARKVAGPQTFSIELWFKTTTNTGGKLIGFGNSKKGKSSSYDRQIYMLNDGQLVFGVGATKTIETSDAYNDGKWHDVVATLSSSGMSLYVDGSRVGRKPATAAQSFNGYWRVGGDNLSGWSLDPLPNSQHLTEPNSFHFRGTIGDVAVYPAALSAGRVAAHYAANALSH